MTFGFDTKIPAFERCDHLFNICSLVLISGNLQFDGPSSLLWASWLRTNFPRLDVPTVRAISRPWYCLVQTWLAYSENFHASVYMCVTIGNAWCHSIDTQWNHGSSCNWQLVLKHTKRSISANAFLTRSWTLSEYMTLNEGTTPSLCQANTAFSRFAGNRIAHCFGILIILGIKSTP